MPRLEQRQASRKLACLLSYTGDREERAGVEQITDAVMLNTGITGPTASQR